MWPSCTVAGQIRRTMSAPQYTTMHYVLMAASFFILASLVLGVLLLLRNDAGRRVKVKAPKRHVIKVQPRHVHQETDNEDLILEDLVDGRLTVVPSRRSSMTRQT